MLRELHISIDEMRPESRLYDAVENRDINAVEDLLNSGEVTQDFYFVNCMGLKVTPFGLAVAKGFADIVKVLSDRGDVSDVITINNYEFGGGDLEGQPIEMAIDSGRKDIVRILKEAYERLDIPLDKEVEVNALLNNEGIIADGADADLVDGAGVDNGFMGMYNNSLALKVDITLYEEDDREEEKHRANHSPRPE